MRIITCTIALLFSLSHIYGQAKEQKLNIAHVTEDFYVYTTYSTYEGNIIPANGSL